MISISLKALKINIYLALICTIAPQYCFSLTKSEKARIIHFDARIPRETELRNRVLTTIACDDCKDIPTDPNAGNVIRIQNVSYQLMHNGIKILQDCYYGKWMTQIIRSLKGYHEPQEEKAFYEVLKYLPKDAVMIELGSYWGYYSLWFQKEILDAKNYLIEPDIKNLWIGKKNFDLNNAIGDFTHAMIGGVSAEKQEFINWDYEKSYIRQVCMDDFAKLKNIPYIHLLHSDIQGAEVEMLRGCKSLIENRRIGYLFISTHRGVHEKCLDILDN